MKIEMTAISAGPGGVHKIGDARDVPEQQAVELVAGGFAKYAGSVEPEAEPPTLESMSHDKLKTLCKVKGLSIRGNRETLIERLRAKKQFEDDVDDQPDERAVMETPENTAIR